MKKLLIALFIFAVMPLRMHAQEVFSRPIAEDHKRWVYQRFPTQEYFYEYFTDGDTIISDRHAYRLYYYNYEPKEIKYMGAIYDQERKTYIIDPEATEPRTLLDFDVSVGDTLLLTGQQVIVKKDTIGSIKGQFYRFLYLYNKTRSEANDGFDPSSGYWIEGVGSLSPDFCYSASWSAWHHVRLDQCYVDGNLIFQLADFDQPVVDVVRTFPENNPYRTDDIYNLSGHRVGQGDKGLRACPSEHLRSTRTETQGNRLPKGVYIQNGKKFVIK